MISRKIIEDVDRILDAHVSDDYKVQPLAQDWARISKVIEELGEAISEWILYTGQNPRKERDPEAYHRLLAELADTAMTGIYAIQHFTKNADVTMTVLLDAQSKHHKRLCNGNR